MNKLNTYTCDSCGKVIVTVHKHEGTTPMFLLCRATAGCNGRMISSMYAVDQNQKPTHEWYKPKKLPRDRGMREYIEMGGLMIREIK